MEIKDENVVEMFDGRFVRVFDLQYKPGKHYYNATRRSRENLVATKTDGQFKEMLPDAVSIVVIVQGKQDRLLLDYEYRYPAGRFLLSVPAGLIDEKDKSCANPLINTAIREMKEETGLDLSEDDDISVINPLLFSTPGMTDESNGLVLVKVKEEKLKELSHDGAEGSELFADFKLYDKQQAKELLKNGCDENGNFYSIFTWAALMCFVSELY